MTGASGGLGEEVAAAYAARGCAVVLSARRRRELDRVAARCREAGAPTAEVVPLDQGDGQSVERALREALKAPLDVVVLNGGIGSRAAALDTDAATLRRNYGLFWRGGAWSGVPGVGARCGNGLFSTYKSPKILS